MRAIRQTIMGLPTEGAMGTQPAMTVGGLMAVLGVVLTILSNYFGWQLPPDVQAFADEYGSTLAGAAIAAFALIQGWITRNRVISPNTADKLISGKVAP